MKSVQIAAVVLLIAGVAHGTEPPVSQRVSELSTDSGVIFDSSIVNGTFFTGPLNWFFQAGGTQLSMRGFANTSVGGTVDSVTACLYNESFFIRRLSATVQVRQGSITVQSIEFARDFPAERSTCHRLTGFDAEIEPGEFSIVVSYDVFAADNVFLGLPATDSGQTFDVQVGSQRPPQATGAQGPIPIRGVGIRYVLIENDEQPPPPPEESACIRDDSTACLLGGRFRVTVDWETATDSGSGKVMNFGGSRAESDQSVFMWFFNPANFELGIKMTDACVPQFNQYWVFVSGLTNQGFTVTIEDTETGSLWTHANPLGTLALTESDTEAFDCP